MRMWNVNPEVMCRKHLFGEHVETHMFIGTLKQGKSLQGYINKGLVEVRNIISRHNELAKEIERRGYNHNSPMPNHFLMPTKYFVNGGHVDKKNSLKELASRCEDCRLRQQV